jgi:Zn-dependent peptidase ImmA (M78 family)
VPPARSLTSGAGWACRRYRGSVVDPEQRAAEVLAALPAFIWDGHALPVPVEAIADSHFGLLVREHEELASVTGAPALATGDTLSGLLLVDEREIWVSAAEARASTGRRRFTIAHELGHWVLHRSPHGTVFCRTHAVVTEPAGPTVPDIEEQASLFAAVLLFPDALVRAQRNRLGGDLDALAETFGGSRVATERAVFRAVRLPHIRDRHPDLTVFFWSDEAYDAWRAAHPDGWVVNDNLHDPERSRRHRAHCSYLRHPVRPGRPRTRDPKWCSDDEQELGRAFLDVARCSRCGG